MELTSLKWTNRFLRIAREVSTWSKDPSTRVGVVAVSTEGKILSTGYNGFPSKLDDKECRLVDRETKYAYTVHGEMNCIYNAASNGVSLKNSTMFVYGLPVCSECCKGVIQSGVSRVVCMYDRKKIEVDDNKWGRSLILSKAMFDEAGVVVEILDISEILE